MAERLANLLRAVADRLDPPELEQPNAIAYACGSPPPRGMYHLDFRTGEVWLDGELISRGSTDG